MRTVFSNILGKINADEEYKKTLFETVKVEDLTAFALKLGEFTEHNVDIKFEILHIVNSIDQLHYIHQHQLYFVKKDRSRSIEHNTKKSKSPYKKSPIKSPAKRSLIDTLPQNEINGSEDDFDIQVNELTP